MPESPIFHSAKSERQRLSNSKKKGIKVSLTPSQSSKYSQFDISQIQINKIAELPLVGNHSSNAKSFSEQNHPRIRLNFTYQSPVRQQFNEVEGKFLSSHNQSPMVIQSMKIYDPKYERDKTFISSPILSNVEQKANQPSEDHYPRGREIRPTVFDIVKEIASKAYRIDNQSTISQKNFLSSCVQQQNLVNNIEKQTKQSIKQSGIAKQPTQKMQSLTPESALQTSQQLIKTHQKEMVMNNTIYSSNAHQNNNFEHQMRDQQVKRFQRFKKAEQKLYEIITICDNKI